MKAHTKEVETDLYEQACRLRDHAEKYCDPGKYQAAAEMFERAGYIAAADRCRERAEFYSRPE